VRVALGPMASGRNSADGVGDSMGDDGIGDGGSSGAGGAGENDEVVSESPGAADGNGTSIFGRARRVSKRGVALPGEEVSPKASAGAQRGLSPNTRGGGSVGSGLNALDKAVCKGSASLPHSASCQSLASATSGNDDDDGISEKKQRFVWTPEVHQSFCDAVHQLGVHKAKPQAISAIMQSDLTLLGPNMPTRQNIKSHLQKYRLLLAKRKEQEDRSSRIHGGGSSEYSRRAAAMHPSTASSPRSQHSTSTAGLLGALDASAFGRDGGLGRSMLGGYGGGGGGGRGGGGDDLLGGRAPSGASNSSMLRDAHGDVGNVDPFSAMEDDSDAAFHRVFGLSHQAFDLSDIAAPSSAGNFDFSQGLGPPSNLGGSSSLSMGGLGGSGGLHGTLGGLPMSTLSGLQQRHGNGDVSGRIEQPLASFQMGGGVGSGSSRKRPRLPALGGENLSGGGDATATLVDESQCGGGGEDGEAAGGSASGAGETFGLGSDEGQGSFGEGRGSSASEGSSTQQALLDMFN